VKNKIYNEDCLDTINRNLDYDYVITSPPDFDELNFKVTFDGILEYKTFLRKRLEGLNPSTGNITIFMSDRKDNGIKLKNKWLCEIMQELGYEVSYRGIWVKSFKKNQRRLTFTDIHTFRRSDKRCG
jgi:DNA modification methylase